jgi:predicted nucleic acid-binding protein
VIYVDSSVALARLLLEVRAPADRIWRQHLVSSRLLEYEVWNRIHAYGLTDSVGENTRALIGLVDIVEMTRSVLARALAPFPRPVRTLDALHLATAEYLYQQDGSLELGSYDENLKTAATALGIPLAEL